MKILKTASGKRSLHMSRHEWQSIGKRAGWIQVKAYELPSSNSSYWTEVDNNTQIIGKIKTVPDAKRILGKGNLPRAGRESLVDSGTINLSDDSRGKLIPNENGIPRKYKTYLQNNSGTFRVWTWIEA